MHNACREKKKECFLLQPVDIITDMIIKLESGTSFWGASDLFPVGINLNESHAGSRSSERWLTLGMLTSHNAGENDILTSWRQGENQPHLFECIVLFCVFWDCWLCSLCSLNTSVVLKANVTSQLLFFVRNLLACSSQFSSPNTSSDLPPCFQQRSATGCLSVHSRGATGKHHIFVNKLEISRDLQMVGAPLQLAVDQRYFS